MFINFADRIYINRIQGWIKDFILRFRFLTDFEKENIEKNYKIFSAVLTIFTLNNGTP